MHDRSDPDLSQLTIGELLEYIARRLTSDAWTMARLTLHRDGHGREPVTLVVTRKDSDHGPR